MKPDKETLRRMYEDELMDIPAISEKVNLPWYTVRYLMVKHGIPRRTGGKSQSLKTPRKVKHDIAFVKRLYEQEGLSIALIAKRIGGTFWSAREALLDAGVTMRPASSGLAYQGRELPTKEDLFHYVHVEHIPLSEIGAMYGICGPSIARHLDKHGIVRPEFRTTIHRGEIPIPPDEPELRGLVAEMVPLEEIAERFGVTRAVISKLCDKHGIPKRPGGMSEEYYACKDGHQVRSRYEQRVDNWLHENGIPHEYEPKLKFNRRFKSDFLANDWYIEIWGMGKRDSAYMERRRRKTNYYMNHGLPLIQIEPQDFNADRCTWAKKLQACIASPPENPWLPLKFDPEPQR